MKKIFVWILCIICLISFTNAGINDDDRLYYWLPLQNNISNMIHPSQSFSFGGSQQYVECFNGQYCLNVSVGRPYRLNDFKINSTDFTFTGWFNKTSGTGTEYLLYHSYGGDANRLVFRTTQASNWIEVFTYDGINQPTFRITDLTTLQNGSYWFYEIKRNSTHNALYIYDDECNFYKKASDSNNPSTSIDSTTQNEYFGDGTASYSSNTYIKDYRLYARELTSSEILQICQYTVGTDSGVNPSITINTDLVNNTINYNFDDINISFNGTIVNNSEIYDCILYDGNIQLTNNTNLNLSNNNIFNYNFGNIEDTFLFNLYCSNANATDRTINYTYKVDTIQPRINISGFTNGEQFQQNDVLSYSVNFTDVNLFAYNVTVLDVNKNVWGSIQYFAENLTKSSYVNSSSFTLTEIGNYSFIAEGWDSHTKNFIDDYKIKNLNNGVEIEDSIKLYSDYIKKIELKKKIDRYNFFIEFNKQEYYQEIYLTSINKLYYIEDSKYNLHFVDFQNKKWIDFETLIPITNTEITLINNSIYKIGFYFSEKTKYVTYDSIGDLNYNNVTYTYSVVSQDTALYEAIISLNQTNTNINNTLSKLEGDNSMLWIIISILVFFILGIISKVFVLWVISGAFSLFGAYNMFRFSGTENYYNAGTMFFFFLGLALMLIGVLLQLITAFNNKKISKNSFYKGY